jgi:hypothetical protein
MISQVFLKMNKKLCCSSILSQSHRRRLSLANDSNLSNISFCASVCPAWAKPKENRKLERFESFAKPNLSRFSSTYTSLLIENLRP